MEKFNMADRVGNIVPAAISVEDLERRPLPMVADHPDKNSIAPVAFLYSGHDENS